jgi:hypothetical protein
VFIATDLPPPPTLHGNLSSVWKINASKKLIQTWKRPKDLIRKYENEDKEEKEEF